MTAAFYEWLTVPANVFSAVLLALGGLFVVLVGLIIAGVRIWGGEDE
jgi:hypothetical protein